MTCEIISTMYQKTSYQFQSRGVWKIREIISQTSVFSRFRDGGERRNGCVDAKEKYYVRVVQVLPGDDLSVRILVTT